MGNEFPVMGSMQADWAGMVGSWWVRKRVANPFHTLKGQVPSQQGWRRGVQKEQSLLGCRPVAGSGLPLSAESVCPLGRAQAGCWRRS